MEEEAVITLRKVVRDWWDGEIHPSTPKSLTDDFHAYAGRHWTANYARRLKRFYIGNWQFFLSLAVGLMALVFAWLAL